MTKSITKMIDSLTPFLDQFFWRYLCFSKHFDHLSFWGCCSDNMADDIIFTNSTWFLKFLQLFNWNAQNPPMIFKSLFWIMPPRKRWLYGIWRSRGNKSRSLTDAGKQTWVVKECQSWQRHLSSWCYSETWLDHIIKASHRQSHLLIHLSLLFKNPWQNLQSFPSS